MKIYVYAIAKNEALFAERWVKSMSEADGIFVLDTGSTDKTAEILCGLGCHVSKRSIVPWRFDTARNESMRLVPPDADLLVCTDLDEILLPGWRKALETHWRQGCTTARYEYVWSFNPDGSDGVKFLYEKVHLPSAAEWTHPVHEILHYSVPKVYCDIPEMRLEHHPDASKSRGSYLALLEMSVQEDPEDDRNMHYLGREYMFHGQWKKAIQTLLFHLDMPNAKWEPERAASMRYIARCFNALRQQNERELWLYRAALEAPRQRESWLELGRLYYEQQDYARCVKALTKCLDIKQRDLSYISTPEAWGALPWDLISIAWWHLGQKEYAANCAKEALRYGADSRIETNLKIFESSENNL